MLDKKYIKFNNLSIKLKKKDLDAFVSGNPFRTKQLFEMFGIDLTSSSYYESNKELINSIVVKRNNVLHHNDDASDLSNSDIIIQLEEIRKYALEIDKIIERKITNRQHCIQRS